MRNRTSAQRLLIVGALSLSTVATAQQGVPGDPSPRPCFAPSLAETALQASGLAGGKTDCSATSTTIRPEYEPANGFVYKIPVVWHVIHSGRAGNLSRAYIESQMRVINECFNAIPGTPGENGTNARMWFYLATEDPSGNPTTGIERVDNDIWFNEITMDPRADPFTFLSALAWDTNRYVNIYTKWLPAFIAGGASGPYSGFVGTPEDSIVLNFRSVGRPSLGGLAGPLRQWDMGLNGTHELGHWAGLSHTFEGGCGTADCYETGDLICDTNAQNGEIYRCPAGSNTCGAPDPLDNYMGYGGDSCRGRFTPEQVNRMRCTLENWRPDIHRPLCSTPSLTTVRSAPPNPDALTATPAELATELAFTIDTRPHDFAVVLSRSAPAQVALPDGQVLLINLAKRPAFSTGLLAGPDAEITLFVPLEPSLCGLSFSSQGVLFGGQTPFALTNAIDFVIGG